MTIRVYLIKKSYFDKNCLYLDRFADRKAVSPDSGRFLLKSSCLIFNHIVLYNKSNDIDCKNLFLSLTVAKYGIVAQSLF